MVGDHMGILVAVFFFLPPPPPWRAGRRGAAPSPPYFSFTFRRGEDAPPPQGSQRPRNGRTTPHETRKALSPERRPPKRGKPALPFAVGHGRDRDLRGTRRTGSGLTRGEGEGRRGRRTGTDRNRGPGLCLCLFRPAVRFPVYYSPIPNPVRPIR